MEHDESAATLLELLLRPREGVNNFHIQNLVIGGTLNNYAAAAAAPAAAEAPPPGACSDEVVARAIAAVNGRDKPLREKQLFLAVIKVLVEKCGWGGNWTALCDRIRALPGAAQWEVQCDANNLRAPTALRFAAVSYREWGDYEPTREERQLFQKNRALAMVFEQELERQMGGH